jgi:small subunit ribosomal protein S8
MLIKSDKVDIPISKMKLEIAKIMKEEGFIRAYKILKDRKQGTLRVIPKYVDNQSIITGLKRVSRPGRRYYVNKDEIPKVMGGLGVAIITTSKGIMSDKTCRQEGVGGEVICYVW